MKFSTAVILAATLAVFTGGVVAFADSPGGGVQSVTAPLAKHGTRVSIPKADATHDGYLSHGDWVLFSNGTGGGGGGAGATVSASITGAQTQCTTFYPIDNTPPLITEGCQIATVSVTPAGASDRIVVEGHAIVGNSGASHNACWVTQGTDPAHAVTSQFMSASDVGDADMFVMWVTSAATTSARSYSLYCASDSSNGKTLYINAAYTGNAEFGGTYASGVWVTDYGAGSGGGSGVLSGTAPLVVTGTDMSIPAATNSTSGYLTSTDHAAFAATCDAQVSLPAGTITNANYAFFTRTCSGNATTDECSISVPAGSSRQGAVAVSAYPAGSNNVTITEMCNAAAPCTVLAETARVICRH